MSDETQDTGQETEKPKLSKGEWTAITRADCIEKTGIDPLKTADIVKLPPMKGQRRNGCQYSEAVAAAICDRLLQGETMASITNEPNMPNFSTIWQWGKDNEEFRQRLEQAKRDGAHYIADDCLRIADDQTIDPMHKRIMVDTRLRLIKSWHRKAYGDNVQLSGDENGSPVRFFIDGLSDQARREEPIAPALDKPKE